MYVRIRYYYYYCTQAVVVVVVVNTPDFIDKYTCLYIYIYGFFFWNHRLLAAKCPIERTGANTRYNVRRVRFIIYIYIRIYYRGKHERCRYVRAVFCVRSNVTRVQTTQQHVVMTNARPIVLFFPSPGVL